MTASVTTSSLTPAGPESPQRAIRLPQLLLSLLVVATFALLAVWWQADSTSRVPVLALAVDVAQGEPLRSAQLTEIYVSSDVPANVVPASRIAQFVNARPVTNLSAGTFVTSEMFVGGAELEPGQAFVGLILDGTQAPIGIVAGDRVQVLLPTSSGVEPLSVDARVENATYDGSNLRVRLRLDLRAAQQVQASSNRVVLIEVENSGLAPWESEDPS